MATGGRGEIRLFRGVADDDDSEINAAAASRCPQIWVNVSVAGGLVAPQGIGNRNAMSPVIGKCGTAHGAWRGRSEISIGVGANNGDTRAVA